MRFSTLFLCIIFQITEDKLKQLFSEKGVVTDIQLKYTGDGKFRQFAFVGYQNESQANEAIEYFNKMCINTYRLNVSHCVGLGKYNYLFIHNFRTFDMMW